MKEMPIVCKLWLNFDRTLNNCKFYEKQGLNAALLNEIGVLRGCSYALETVGVCPHSAELEYYIDIQNELKETL